MYVCVKLIFKNVPIQLTGIIPGIPIGIMPAMSERN